MTALTSTKMAAIRGQGGGSETMTITMTDSPIIPETPFASTYKSVFTAQEPVKPLTKNMPHVNCCYLSTPGKAPTLLQLKQHAQSLCVLIKYLTVNTIPGLINNAEAEVTGAPTFSDGESYDFLNDLSKVYEGPVNQTLEKHHTMPLTALVNVLEPESNSTSNGPGTRSQRHYHGQQQQQHQSSTRPICPLHTAVASEVGENHPSLPYATHQALIAHANELLELIDHEYAAKGGLLGILPDASTQKEDYEKAAATLLGQNIIYTQRLAQRTHDLERELANALDVIRGEAATPMQCLSALGPDGRKPREMVYPQDRFVLVNAGEDVWQYLHKEFAEKERADERVADMYARSGAAGQALWAQNGGKEYFRGLTCIDVYTRYYRLRQDPLKTVFVIPAHTVHPGTKATREMEGKPSVVAVTKPVWPERVTQWEMKHRAELDELKELRQKYVVLEQDVEAKKTAETLLANDNRVKDAVITSLHNELALQKEILAYPENKKQETLVNALNQAAADRQAALAAKREAEEATEAAEDGQKEVDRMKAEWREKIARADRERAEQMAKMTAEYEAWTKAKKDDDERLGKAATELTAKVQNMCNEKLREINVIVHYLRQKKVEVDSGITLDPDAVQAGFDEARDLVRDAFAQSQMHGGFEYSESDSSMSGY